MENMEEIYRQYSNIVYKYLISLTKNEQVAEELVQETFYYAVKDINKFKGECKIYVWLCQIAKNLWYKEIKKNKNRKLIEMDKVAEDLTTKDTMIESLIQKEEKDYLYQQIERLDEKTKEIIYLRVIGELSFKQIGEIFHKTDIWARVNFYRGKQKIKERYENEGK